MSKYKLFLYAMFFLAIKNFAFAKFCVKNDLGFSLFHENNIIVYINDFKAGFTLPRSSIAVFEKLEPGTSGYVYFFIDKVSGENNINVFSIKDIPLVEGDLLHIGGDYDDSPTKNWVEKGNCDWRVTTPDFFDRFRY